MDSSNKTSNANPRTIWRIPPGRILLWVGGIIVAVVMALVIVSFLLDGFLRPRLEERMNASLKGYRVTLGHSHFQLAALRLTLRRLTIVQIAHPAPPVADFPMMRFHVHWPGLMYGHIVGDVEIWRPRIHINQPQLITEVHSKTSLRQRGWQDALEAIYPFKIDRLAIHDGDVIYVDSKNAKPLHVTSLNFVTDNIRNIREPNNVYPSTFSGSMGMFGPGQLKVDGRANYLMKPFPGMVANYAIQKVPLGAITPASQHVNIVINGGTLASEGSVEYSPKATNVKVQDARIDKVELNYVHLAQTQQAEAERVSKVGEAVQKENNRPGTNIEVNAFEIRNSRLSYKNEDSDPRYVLFIDDANLAVRHFSNHAEHGPSRLDLTGKFMGSGATHVDGTFVAGGAGPEFACRIEIVKTQLTALNPLLRAEGRIDVSLGTLSVYAQVRVKNNRISGYVKPLFADLEIYNPEKDKNKSVLQKAKSIVVGAAAHLLKNQKTQKVASDIDISGSLSKPDVSTWQAIIEVVRNAFIRAILPGFDREVGAPSGGKPQTG
jgi:hypothetical protein